MTPLERERLYIFMVAITTMADSILSYAGAVPWGFYAGNMVIFTVMTFVFAFGQMPSFEELQGLPRKGTMPPGRGRLFPMTPARERIYVLLFSAMMLLNTIFFWKGGVPVVLFVWIAGVFSVAMFAFAGGQSRPADESQPSQKTPTTGL